MRLFELRTKLIHAALVAQASNLYGDLHPENPNMDAECEYHDEALGAAAREYVIGLDKVGKKS